MRQIRISIATIVTILICIGIVMIFSSSGVYARQELKQTTYFLNRHLVFLVIGFILTFSIMALDYRDLRKYAKPMLIITIAMLVFVLFPGIGKITYGARRWFSFGPINFQPSELAKITMLIYVADFLARKKGKIASFKEGFLPIILILGVVSVLILKQPDLGNVVLIASITLIMIFLAGARVSHILSLGLLSLPALYILVFKVPYRLKRIVAFLDPWQDSQGAGFQLTQSQIALGSGGVFGVGLGKSMQKLFYLPAAHTDFIFSIIGEELGLIGTFVILILFIAFIWQGARIVKRTTNPFGYFLAVGIVSMLGLQAVVNLGVSIGAFPTKGLPLPFISYGGSALIFNMMAVGLLLNISRIEDL
ncbi:MAG: putative lipid II flippase FtsW [Candidatus Omnitrophica bacterium]|nr:putative lipid II flippase FtsW [Candidatus Omnitrophota bacterium]